MNSDIKIKIINYKKRGKKTEVDYLRCNNSYALKNKLETSYTFDESLKLTIDWFVKNYKTFYGSDTYKN